MSRESLALGALGAIVLILLWAWRRSRWCSCFFPGNIWMDTHNRTRCGKCNGRLLGGE